MQPHVAEQPGRAAAVPPRSRSRRRRRSEAETDLLDPPATRGGIPSNPNPNPDVRARVRRRVGDTENAHANAHANATPDELDATLRTLQTEMSSLEEAAGTRPARLQNIAH